LAYSTSIQLCVGNWVDFVEAVWRGEVIPEDHAYNRIVSDHGSGYVLDTTKAFLWELAADEVAELFPEMES